VTGGLYRYSRNPMYVAVLLILLGWAISFEAAGLFGYAVVVGLAFHLRVVMGEESWLARTHGEQWFANSPVVPRSHGQAPPSTSQVGFVDCAQSSAPS